VRKQLLRLVKIVVLAAVLPVIITVLQTAALNFYNPSHTAWMKMRMRESKSKGKTLTIRKTFVSLEKIPLVMQRAVIKAEDDAFYQHFGFDWEAMKQAYERNERKGRIKRGGSTITQQLAKNLYLYPERSYWRKIREAVITGALELTLSKRRILELYLNNIEWGPGIFGIEQAAQYHFGKKAEQLNLEQSCILAAIIPAPRRYKVNGGYVSRRAERLMQIIGGK